jgi:hypothetical protein
MAPLSNPFPTPSGGSALSHPSSCQARRRRTRQNKFSASAGSLSLSLSSLSSLALLDKDKNFTLGFGCEGRNLHEGGGAEQRINSSSILRSEGIRGFSWRCLGIAEISHWCCPEQGSRAEDPCCGAPAVLLGRFGIETKTGNGTSNRHHRAVLGPTSWTDQPRTCRHVGSDLHCPLSLSVSMVLICQDTSRHVGWARGSIARVVVIHAQFCPHHPFGASPTLLTTKDLDWNLSGVCKRAHQVLDVPKGEGEASQGSGGGAASDGRHTPKGLSPDAQEESQEDLARLHAESRH